MLGIWPIVFFEAVVKDDVNMLKRSVRSKIGLVASTSQRVLKKLIVADGMTCNGIFGLLFRAAQSIRSIQISIK